MASTLGSYNVLVTNNCSVEIASKPKQIIVIYRPAARIDYTGPNKFGSNLNGALLSYFEDSLGTKTILEFKNLSISGKYFIKADEGSCSAS